MKGYGSYTIPRVDLQLSGTYQTKPGPLVLALYTATNAEIAQDAREVIAQARVPILPNDTAETLAARVLIEEHKLYPAAVRRFAEGRLRG